MKRHLAVLLTCAVAAIGLPLSQVSAGPPTETLGLAVKPAQPYRDNPSSYDWLGRYRTPEIGEVFCVDFARDTPADTDTYGKEIPLTDKWGKPLEAGAAAKVDVLLAKWGSTKDTHEAAAVAHLLHTLTSGHGPVGADRTFGEVGYDVTYHYEHMPREAQETTDRLTVASHQLRGPWTLTVTPPTEQPLQGSPRDWQVKVTAASGSPVPDVAVNVSTAGAVEKTATVRTNEAGAASVALTPTGETATLNATVHAPSGQPVMRRPTRAVSQKIGVINRLAPVRASASIHAIPSGQLVLSRTIAGDQSNKPVAGAVLAIANTNGDLLTKVTTSDTPQTVTLPAQPVVITEENAPEGLVASDNSTTVRVEAGKSTTVTIGDRVDVTLIKRDLIEHDKTLPGAEFRIYSDTECKDMVWVGLTGDNGAVTITGGLPAGTYWVTETKAPAGYALNTLIRQLVVPADPKPVELTLFNARPVHRGTHKTPVTAITAGRMST